jgi:serine/threonine protein kinase
VSKYGGKVAVKLLYERPGLDDHLFENELNNLKILKHPNIVSLFGHCNETQKVPVEFNGRVVLAEKINRALCFEYLENGNLKRHLHGTTLLQVGYIYYIIKHVEYGPVYLLSSLQMNHVDLTGIHVTKS